MKNQIKIGDIVLSKAGRDGGRYYVVMAREDNFAYICDGDLHKVEKPKKKKLKHLKLTDKKSDNVAEKQAKGIKIINSELRKAIKEFNSEADASEEK